MDSAEKRKNMLIAVSLSILMLTLSSALYIGGIWFQPLIRVRALAEIVLRNAYNPWNTTLTSYSLNAVSAIIWDYRGLDTIFETAVLLVSITGVTVLLGGGRYTGNGGNHGMGPVVGFSTKLVVLITLLIAFSTAIHGHLTPGGGFQAGVMLAAVAALSIPVFSVKAIYAKGLKKEALLYSRYLMLVLIIAVALLPLMVTLKAGNAYIMQNQVKDASTFSLPAWFIDTPLAGSVFFYNLLEALAVALALSYAMLLLIELGSRR
ncbi:MAG: MnhB domain-containing protein [Desulfurococcaceae archaeon]